LSTGAASEPISKGIGIGVRCLDHSAMGHAKEHLICAAFLSMAGVVHVKCSIPIPAGDKHLCSLLQAKTVAVKLYLYASLAIYAKSPAASLSNQAFEFKSSVVYDLTINT